MYGAREIGQKRGSAFEHAHHYELLAAEVTGNLGAHLGDALGNLLAGKKDLKTRVGVRSHADSIARIMRHKASAPV